MAMAVTGHKTREVLERHSMVTERDVGLVTDQLAPYIGSGQDPEKLGQSAKSLKMIQGCNCSVGA